MKLLIWCVLAFALLAGSVYLRKQDEFHLRYVSAPLNDGTRYTFLYPHQMKVISSSNTSLLLRSHPQITPLDRIQGWMKIGSAVKFLGGMKLHDLSVQVSSQTKPLKNSREVEDWTLYVDDARSGKSFYVEDQYWGTERQDQKSKREVIMNSFRVLSPQESVPSH